jgi:uncharacterized Zn finger protein
MVQSHPAHIRARVLFAIEELVSTPFAVTKLRGDKQEDRQTKLDFP